MRLSKTVDWRLCFIADFGIAEGDDLIRLVDEAVAGGATIIQLRGKARPARQLYEVGRELARLLRPKKIPLIINDRPDIAAACGAAGVHLGQEDLPAAAARKILGRTAVIGVSAGTPEEALGAMADGADYVGAGPVFSTATKPDIRPPIGVRGLRKICRRVSVPVLAIGGISAANAGRVIRAGADGVAVISAIASAEDPRRAAQNLIKSIEKVRFVR